MQGSRSSGRMTSPSLFAVQSTTVPLPVRYCASYESRVAPSSKICAGASMWVPVCENIVMRVSRNPSFSMVFAFSRSGFSVPGNTGISASIICVRSVTFIIAPFESYGI